MSTEKMKKFEKDFKKQFGRELSKTSIGYLTRGSFVEVFKTQKRLTKKQGLTIWGFVKVDRLTKKVLRHRIYQMTENIENNIWTGRKLRFATHYLAYLIRKLSSF